MRKKLLFSFAAVILVTLVSVAFFVRQETEQQVTAFIYRGGIYGAEGLVQALENYYSENGSWEGVEPIFQTPGRGPGGGGGTGLGQGPGSSGKTLVLYDAQGNLVYDPHNSDTVGTLGQAESRSAVPLVVDNITRGYLFAPDTQIFSIESEQDLKDRLNRASINAALIAGGLSLLLALVLTFYLLRPVRALTHAVVRMAGGDLSQRVRVNGKDEIAALGTAFNEMASSLEGEQERRQGMTADIAHELRTPLAIQRANLEAMLDGVEPVSEANIQVVLEQNKLLERLVADLRTLALADAGELKLDLQSTDLNQLVNGVVESYQSRARQMVIRFSLEYAKPLQRVLVDPVRIEQILVNLVENALQYAEQGGLISIRTYMQGHAAAVSIHDSGPGIPEERLEQIFERFYRADNSRSREFGGTGLGLAIARKLAEAHRGKLTAENHPNGGAVFTLILSETNSREKLSSCK